MSAPGRNEEEQRWSGWMAEAQTGDADAYRRLLIEIVPAVRRQVHARLSDHGRAEDVVQNVLLSIHRARHTYRPERAFGPWMRAIARNAVVDSLRQHGRRGEREVAVEAIEEIAISPVGPGQEQSGDRLSPVLEQALAALPEAQREAVRMIQLEGLSVAEAAARAGVSAGALKVRAHRGYKALRKALEGVEL